MYLCAKFPIEPEIVAENNKVCLCLGHDRKIFSTS